MKNTNPTYTFKAVLMESKPKTWRKFQMQSSSTAEEFSRSILMMFNANIGHLYDLKNSKNQLIFSTDPQEKQIQNISLSELFNGEGDKAVLEYDFGDNWKFEITLEKIKETSGNNKLMGGKGFGIFDDIGGITLLNGLHYVHPELTAKLSQEQIDYFVRRINSDGFALFSSKGTPLGQQLLPNEELISFDNKDFIDWNKLGSCILVKVSLKGAQPPIWREICVNDAMTIQDFIEKVLLSFDADLSHLWRLYDRFNNVICENDKWDNESEMNENSLISNLVAGEYEWPLRLWYDFGDDWMFNIQLKGDAFSTNSFSILKGKGRGIIEDCGGVWALNQIVAREGSDWEFDEEFKEIR